MASRFAVITLTKKNSHIIKQAVPEIHEFSLEVLTVEALSV